MLCGADPMVAKLGSVLYLSTSDDPLYCKKLIRSQGSVGVPQPFCSVTLTSPALTIVLGSSLTLLSIYFCLVISLCDFMVLPRVLNLELTSIFSKGLTISGHKFETFGVETFKNFLFSVCKACADKMASIPPSAFSAARIRETQRDMKVSNIKKSGEPMKFFNTKLMELTPLKYNSKLMNSIWGFYNRYSPHNVKKINDAFTFKPELQQSAVNSNNKNDAKITLPQSKLDNMWATIKVSQSH